MLHFRMIHIILLFLVLVPSLSFGQTTPVIYVNNTDSTCGGQSPCVDSLNAALAAVQPGETIRLQAGLYTEQVLIRDKNNSSSSSEADRIVIEADPAFPAGSVVFQGTADRCTLGYLIRLQRSKFITIRGLALTGAGGQAIELLGGNNGNTAIRIERNRIVANGSNACNGGVTVARGNEHTLLSNNLIYGNGRNGVSFTGAQGGPHYVVGNTIYGNGWNGVSIAAQHLVWLVNNAVTHNGSANTQTGGRSGVRHQGDARLEDIHLLHNLLCGNRTDEITGDVLDGTDSGNVSPTGQEGPGIGPIPGCEIADALYDNVLGLDAVANTVDDNLRPAASSPLVDQGTDPRSLEFAVVDALFEAGFFGPDARPRDGDSSSVAEFDIGAIEINSLVNDITPPELSIIAPASGSLVIQSRPLIEVGYSDSSGVDPDSLSFMANGTPLSMDCTVNVAGGTCTPSSDLPEGAVTLMAVVADTLGNQAMATVGFTLDSQPVTIQIDTPLDGLITKEAEILVSGTTGPDIAAVTVNGVAASLGNSFSATIPLRDGMNTLIAVATKTSGKTGTDVIEVTRDTNAPIVQITSPSDGSVTAVNTLSVSGQVNDIVNGATDAQVMVNGIAASVSNGSFFVSTLALTPGTNNVEAVATDSVGNEGRHSISVTLETPTGPRINPVSGNGQRANVQETLPDPLLVEIINNQGNPLAGQFVRFEVSRNSGTLQVVAGDASQRTVDVPTDNSGQAAVLFTLGASSGEGNQCVRASAPGVTGGVEFCASALPLAPDALLLVGGDNQRGAVSNPLANPFEAMVVDQEGNPITGVDVMFSVQNGGGDLNGNPTLTRTTGTDGLARAVLTLGAAPGTNNNTVEASFTGLTGPSVRFSASGLVPGNPDDTRLSGVVLDNSLTPIPGAGVSLLGTSATDTTDEQGQFLLENVSVGHVILHIDPSNSPRAETFPPIEFEADMIAGVENTIGQPILIPPLNIQNAQRVGGNTDVTLMMQGVAGLSLTVFANSVTCPDGSSQCLVSISQVHSDKVPMPPPGGRPFIPPAWTIQPAGVHFDPPAQVTLPNNGLPPGRVVDIFQFDHDINQFINVGKGTVSADGSTITSDPGFGITSSGWGGGGGTPPPPQTCQGQPCKDDDPEDCFRFVGNTCDGCEMAFEPDGKICTFKKGSFFGLGKLTGTCKEGICECARPTNFRQIGSGVDVGGGILHFEYEWESTTGDLSDLSDCEVGEHVVYPGPPGTFHWPRPPWGILARTPNPTVKWKDADAGVMEDNHSNKPLRRPITILSPQGASFSATQTYRYRCQCLGNTPIDLTGPGAGPHTITRTVSRNPDGTFRYEIEKLGDTAEVDPIPP